MKAMLFDMDGVLVDSEPIHFKARKMTMSRYGITIEDEELYGYQSTPMSTFIAGINKSRGTSIDADEAAQFQKIDFKTAFNDSEIVAIDGIPEYLEKLDALKVPMAIASSSTPELIREVTKRLGITKYFREFVSGYEVEKPKPDPCVYLTAAKKINVDPAQCIVLEDSHNGVLSAKAAGMFCIGFRSPHSGNQDLSTADLIVNSIRDIDPSKFFKGAN